MKSLETFSGLFALISGGGNSLGTTEVPAQLNKTIYIERPARVLLGWLSETEAQNWQSVRGTRAHTVEDVERAARARAAVAARQEGVDQGAGIVDPPEELAEYVQQLAEPAAAYFQEGWQVAVADLHKICALQQSVFVDHALQRTADINAADISSIASVSLPLPRPTALPVQFEEHRQTWMVTSANPNLRIVGHFSTPMQGNTLGLGFLIQLMPSFMQVAHVQNRYLLRDGYHRAFGLLSRGIRYEPVLTREIAQIEELALPPGLFNRNVFLGKRPPLLIDYLDETVSATVPGIASQKMIVITGLELTSLT